MDNDIVRFISSLNSGSWLRLLLTVVLTTASVLLAYGVEIGYQLLIGCNLVTVAGTFYLEYKNFKKRSG
jgi:general stress protein CsbA